VEGNLVRKTQPDGRQWRYAWDGAGQLARVTRPDGYAVTFTYDALGRRISKRFRGKVTRWVWDGDVPLHEWHELEVGPGAGSAQDLTTWLFEDDSFVPTAKLTTQGSYSIITDHLGTPLELYDQTGVKTWQAQLDSYGAVREGRGTPQDCPFRYQGQYEDVETGLYYNRFRYYDPETGGYISQDPIRLEGANHSLYAYVKDTNSWIDALGLSCTPSIEAKHIFHGEINANGKPVGFHHEGSIGHVGKARVKTVIDPPNSQGIYRAKVEIYDPVTRSWKAKNAPSTFFPKDWSRARVLQEIREAHNSATITGNAFEGISNSGTRIGGYLDPSGNIRTAFPKL
jgi:RHS repeat-associated protein